MKTFIITLILMMSAVFPLRASDEKTIGMEFWKVFAQGDLEKIQDYYADKVTLDSGSEFLKRVEWGISDPADGIGKVVLKADLMKAYGVMLQKMGKQKWVAIFGAVPEENITAQVKENKNIFLTVKVGKRDDKLGFELAFNKEKNKWQVVWEHTDY